MKFRFGEFELDAAGGELRRKGVAIKLQLQPFKVLEFLLARAGQLVTREEICRHVWGAETFVDYELGLNYCIRQIRHALSEDAAKPRYVETHPRRGYRFVCPVEEIPGERAAAERRVMLAVLPLDNLGGDPRQDYLADGLTDELINELGRRTAPALGVIARTSAMRYKRTTKGVGRIGRELGVDYIVEGAVRRDGDRVRITAQLIRASDQTHVWAHGYERRIQDVLLLQSELASAIAAEVRVKLVPQAAGTGRRVNAAAYEACLKARFLWNRRRREDLYRALEFFSKAIEEDPDYAPAFAGLADTYLVLMDYRFVAPSEALALGTAAATNAVRLDDRLADAYTSLGHAKFHALEWEAAGRELRRAIELNPGYAPARYYYANFLTSRGRFDEAVDQAREALRLDPVSIVSQSNLLMLCYYAGSYEEALERARKVVETEPDQARAHEDLGRILLETGSSREAIACLEKAVSLSKRSPKHLSSLAFGYGVTGSPGKAREILAELTEMSGQRYVASSEFALVHIGMREADQAVSWLERAFREGDSHLPFLQVDPRLKALAKAPRFGALIKQAGHVTAAGRAKKRAAPKAYA